MTDSILFFFEVLVGGLLSGTMYSLVALGFVLIYKASSTFNFAQGAMVFFAVLSFCGFMEYGMPFGVAFFCGCSFNDISWIVDRKISASSINESKRRYSSDGNDWSRFRS